MGTKDSHEVQVKEKTAFEQQLGARNQGLNRNQNQALPEITLELILKKILAGIQKLFVALKYQFHRLTAGVFTQVKLPWFKIGLVVIAFFILAKKDIQFSVNMKAPLAGVVSDDRETDNRMGIVQPIAMKGHSTASLPEVQELDEEKVERYVKRFYKVAIGEMEKFGIPASIKMAQGILESQAGSHPEAKRSNNHFGTPTAGQHFNSAWENWRAQSELLQQTIPDFEKLGNDYHQWAKVLQEQGYSSDPNYADKLIKIIQKYRLNQLDEL